MNRREAKIRKKEMEFELKKKKLECNAEVKKEEEITKRVKIENGQTLIGGIDKTLGHVKELGVSAVSDTADVLKNVDVSVPGVVRSKCKKIDAFNDERSDTKAAIIDVDEPVMIEEKKEEKTGLFASMNFEMNEEE